MKKTIRLTESQLIKVIEKIINEGDGEKKQMVKILIDRAKTYINHAMKEGNFGMVNKIESSLKNKLERMGYDWKSDSEASELLGDFIEEQISKRGPKINYELRKEKKLEHDKIFKELIFKIEQGETIKNALKKLGIDNTRPFYKMLTPEQYAILKRTKASSQGHTRHEFKELEKSLKTKSPWDEYDWKDKEKRYDDYSDLDEKCWKGYTQKGMKTMFGKKYPNCVKKK